MRDSAHGIVSTKYRFDLTTIPPECILYVKGWQTTAREGILCTPQGSHTYIVWKLICRLH